MRPVPALGPGVVALAVYARERDGQFLTQSAAEQGYEGVACLDDAARAAMLYSEIWRRHRFDWARTEAEGLLRFTCAMQMSDGAFVNFIGDWDGRRQLDTPTSYPGGGPWHARAMHALACALSAFGDDRYATAFEAGLASLDRPTPYLDVRATGVLAALEFWRATGAPDLAARALSWAEEIAAARIGDVLPDRAGDPVVHLWGHLQEAALARAGTAFGRDDLVQAAARSADAVLAPAAQRAFAGPRALPFDVSSTVCGLDAVAAATGDPRFRTLAALARAWFDGRNAAGEPVYDRVRGCVFDGIDGNSINRNSGAESNIEGGLALLDSLPWSAYATAPLTPAGASNLEPGR
ncbi:MAG: hypothetical protein M3P30_15445 [Chloroflexota bacterium]|nr:hypothetical protein [Chloroflexota bacterium]